MGATHNFMANYSGNLSGTNAADFSPNLVGCSNPNNGEAGQFCTFPMTFTPTATGTRTAHLSTPSGYLLLTAQATNAAGPSFTAPSTLGVQAYISPSSGIATASFPLSIVNTGTTVLNFPTPVLYASSPSLFSVQGNCSAVAPSATCTFTLGFSGTFNTPTTVTASLLLKEITTGQTQTAAVTARAIYSYPLFSPSSFTFPSQTVNTTSAAQTFTVSDVYGNPLGHPITLSTSSPYAVTPASCPASTTTLCTIQVTFTPTTTGAFTYPYVVANDTVSTITNSLALSGTGTAPPVTGSPALTFSPPSVTFAARPVNSTSIPTTVNLTNSGTGNAPLTLTGISLSGAVNGNFSQTNNCPASLATGVSCTISVTFAPTAAGSQAAFIQVVSNAASSPNTVALSGSTQ